MKEEKYVRFKNFNYRLKLRSVQNKISDFYAQLNFTSAFSVLVFLSLLRADFQRGWQKKNTSQGERFDITGS